MLDLDVIVAMAARQDPVLAAAWRSARRIEGQSTPTSTTLKEPVSASAAEPPASAADPPASPVAAPAPNGDVTSTSGHDAQLEKAS